MRKFEPLLRRSTDRLLAETVDGGLGTASSDYWERKETAVTLETALARLAGLQAAGRCWEAAGNPDRAAETQMRARTYMATLLAEFGPSGFQRYGGKGGADAAVALAMPPLVAGLDEAAAEAFAQAQVTLGRPGGGLAPGESWHDDGLSWTPETAMFALAQAGLGDRTGAERWLDWLDAHRTAPGALPEKVTAGGAPVSVAPLAWTASLVILTLAELREV
jgi:GH15 family glucan-1,4-alpha-glucosidase